MDKLIVIGNLGRDPEMRYLPSGQPVTNFSVASNRKWTDNEGVLHEETIWIRVGDPLPVLTAGRASHTRSRGAR